MPGLEPGTSGLSMLSECAYHLRYIPVNPSAHTHSISGPDLAGLNGLQINQLIFSEKKTFCVSTPSQSCK